MRGHGRPSGRAGRNLVRRELLVWRRRLVDECANYRAAAAGGDVETEDDRLRATPNRRRRDRLPVDQQMRRWTDLGDVDRTRGLVARAASRVLILRSRPGRLREARPGYGRQHCDEHGDGHGGCDEPPEIPAGVTCFETLANPCWHDGPPSVSSSPSESGHDGET